MKKVMMILTNRYDPDVRVHKEAKYLISKGYDVEILCWDRENEYFDRKVEIHEGIRIKRFYPFARYGSGLSQLKAYFQFVLQVRKYLSKDDYEYIHCHDLDGAIAGCLIKSKSSSLIFDMHEIYELQGSKKNIRYIIRALVNIIQNKSEYIIFVNDMQKSIMRNANKDKLVFLPNYPEVSNYYETDKFKAKVLRISYIGAVRQYSELKKLIDACKDMHDVFISIHGNGVAYEKLNNIKRNYKNLNITGRYHYSQSSRLFGETDILYAVYPTNSVQYKIGLPVKLYEAIVTKTPVIANKDTTLGDFVKRNDIGFVVNGDNIDDIRTLIMEIGNNKNVLVEKIRNIETIQFKYNWNEVVKNLDLVYE